MDKRYKGTRYGAFCEAMENALVVLEERGYRVTAFPHCFWKPLEGSLPAGDGSVYTDNYESLSIAWTPCRKGYAIVSRAIWRKTDDSIGWAYEKQGKAREVSLYEISKGRF